MGARTLLKWWRAPLWTLALATGAKSFADNPILGSPALNRRGLHVARLKLAHRLAWARRRRLARALPAEWRQQFDRDGYVEVRDFLPADLFTRLQQALLDLMGQGHIRLGGALLLLSGGCEFYHYEIPSPDRLWHIIPWFDHMITARYVWPYETAAVPRYTPVGTVPVSGGEPDWSAEWTSRRSARARAYWHGAPPGRKTRRTTRRKSYAASAPSISKRSCSERCPSTSPMSWNIAPT